MGGGGGEGDIQYARKSNLGLFLNNKQRPLTQTISCLCSRLQAKSSCAI